MKIQILVDDKEILVNEITSCDEKFINELQKELNNTVNKVSQLIRRRRKNASRTSIKTS